MSSVDWDEVKRLAADFQRAQLSSSAQRLSDRNCIEIMCRLIEDKLIDVFFTTDGKEYITPQHLLKEIKDELFVSGGRINLVDLAKILSVDLQVVTRKATELEKSDSSLRIINGQLISNSYILSLCKEIDEKLQQSGQVSVGDLTSLYDLPSDFLLSAIEKQLGKAIHGIQDKQDREIIFTPSFVEKNLCVVRGALLAITKPVTTATLINLIGVPERLFFSAVESLIERKEMPGTLTGKQKNTGSYVPFIYTKAQQEWINNFYQQNGYLEYQSMSRLGISDPTAFIQKTFSKDNILLLPSVAVGPGLIEQVEASIEDALSSSLFLKTLEILPTVFEDSDAEVLLQKVLQKKGPTCNVQVFNTTVVVTDQYLKNLIKKYDEVLEILARKFVDSGSFLKLLIEKNSSKIEEKADVKVDKKEERRKKASEGKSGGGAQGRETKTKSTKKKYMKGKHAQEDSDDEAESGRSGSKAVQKVEVVRKDDVIAGLQGEELIQDEDEDTLINEVVHYLQPILNRKGIELAQTIYESSMASANQNRRKKHVELQEKLAELMLNIRLFEKGIKQISNVDTAGQLTKHLLKTVCTDVANHIFIYVGQRKQEEMTAEQRLRVANEAPSEVKEVLTRLNKSLSGNSLEEFLLASELALGPSGADIMVYRHDKKKERPEMLHQRELLIEQLNLASDPALVLHLTVLIVFQAATQTLIHASGKFVSSLLPVLEPHLSEDHSKKLRTYHDAVLQLLTNPESRNELDQTLFQEMPNIKEIALLAKRSFSKPKERSISTNSNE